LYNNLDHIALILDGNKRWAKKNKLKNFEGYLKGFENIKKLVKYSLDLKISNLTIFTLSSENFHRSSINIIYNIIYENFSNILDELVKDNGVKIKIFGSRNNLPKKIVDIFDHSEKISSKNNSLNLNIAFNYGFKNEIKEIFKKINGRKVKINFENDKEVEKLFFLGSFPDPDLLIRTGGYQRLSNFIMYKLTYTELFFTETLWPDFTEKEFKSIIIDYHRVRRKYGL
tara:strand:+ start:2807 stop:3490 length:684 start_codon:yes stop_codon:yes gene_type:complete